MPRTVDANLTAALASGSGQPYLMGFIGYSNGAVIHSHRVLSYKLTGQELEFTMDYTADAGGDQTHMWLERGVTIAGTKYSITTGRFAIHQQVYTPGRMTARGLLFPKQYYAASGYDTYQNVITAFCAAYGKTAVFRDAGAAWLTYKFFPTGKYIILNDANSFLNLLAQKYLIFACDNGNEQILFYSCAGSLAGAADETLTLTNQVTKNYNKTRQRQYIWRDEAGSVHTAGTVTDPIHNLGYLESTASAPARMTSPQLSEAIIRPDLRVLDGDIVSFVAFGGTMKCFALATEEFAPPASGHGAPRWDVTVVSNEVFGNTAGGAMPSTIERVSNYTPLNTSMFSGILSAKDNNLQAAMDTLDDHIHYLPFGVYDIISPITLSGWWPYLATPDRTYRLVKWTQAGFVSAPNNATNYWQINLHNTGGQLIAQLLTASWAADAWSQLAIATFNPTTVGTADVFLGVRVVKVGAPGAINLAGPSLQVAPA